MLGRCNFLLLFQIQRSPPVSEHSDALMNDEVVMEDKFFMLHNAMTFHERLQRRRSSC
jgi:hypothetical protein